MNEDTPVPGASDENRPPTPPSPQISLMTCETLDRSSPELWPKQIPGIGEFVSLRDDTDRDTWLAPPWAKLTAPADVRLIQQLSLLSTSSLIIEVKKLHDLAYQLGVEEAKEMTRGKYLNIFKSRRPR